MTKFMTLKDGNPGRKTVITKSLDFDLVVIDDKIDIDDWDYILWLGSDSDYGDVFKIWDEGEDDFIICFGIKGDEFKD